MLNLIKRIFASALLAGGLVLIPNSLNSQDNETEIETETGTEGGYYDPYYIKEKFKGYEIDWDYWSPWEFLSERWHLMDNIGIKKNKISIDSLLITKSDDERTKNYRFFLVLDAKLRSLKAMDHIFPSGDFGIKDEFRIKNGKRPMWVGDYEAIAMYDKLNPDKLEYERDGKRVDDVTLSASRDLTVSREIPFPIGEVFLYNGKRIGKPTKYLEGPIWLYFGKDSTQIYNLDW